MTIWGGARRSGAEPERALFMLTHVLRVSAATACSMLATYDGQAQRLPASDSRTSFAAAGMDEDRRGRGARLEYRA